MRRLATSLLLFVPGLLFAQGMPDASAAPETGVTWLGHASFKIARKNAPVVYIDPWKVAGQPRDGDLILITHPHPDHFSIEDLEKVAKPTAIIVAPAECALVLLAKNPATQGFDVRTVKPGDQLELDGVTVEAVPAYNTSKPYHPKQKNWVGYVVALGKIRYYHAGDTDVIPEMHTIEADVALLPVSGTYVMTAEEAAMAVGMLRPTLAVPMHYGTTIGTEEDAKRFQHACTPIRVKIFAAPHEAEARSSAGSCCARS